MCIDNFFSAAAAALEFFAAIQLRAQRPDLPRPYRVPVGTAGLALCLLLPFGTSLLVMYVTATHSPQTLALCSCATVVGGLMYVPAWVRRKYGSERAKVRASAAAGLDAAGPAGSAAAAHVTS